MRREIRKNKRSRASFFWGSAFYYPNGDDVLKIIQQGSSTAVIVIHEIYGLNRHMKDICRLLGELGVDVFCSDLLGRPAFDYAEEREAYRYFMEGVGFSRAKRIVEDQIDDLRSTYEKVVIVGFSVGATVAWLCSEDGRIDGVVGYYGSRIRQFSELKPNCPVLLFFPRKEPSFDVAELLLLLQKKNVSYCQFEGEHGFSDPYLGRFDEMSSQEAFREMSRFIREI